MNQTVFEIEEARRTAINFFAKNKEIMTELIRAELLSGNYRGPRGEKGDPSYEMGPKGDPGEDGRTPTRDEILNLVRVALREEWQKNPDVFRGPAGKDGIGRPGVDGQPGLDG